MTRGSLCVRPASYLAGFRTGSGSTYHLVGVCRARHSLSHHLAYCQALRRLCDIRDLLRRDFGLDPVQNAVAGL
jgi:hypothetical protein